MPSKKTLIASSAAVLMACALAAQEKPGTIAGLEFQRPKSGMTKQYEEGRKLKAQWHKQQKDIQALYVWEITTGDSTGTYIVGRIGNHWKDYDAPSVPEAADLAAYEKNVGAYVESVVARYYVYLPNISRPAEGSQPSRMSEIFTFQIRVGKEREFLNVTKKIHEAIQKTNWPVRYAWYALVNGGRARTFVLSIPVSKWADLEPPDKPFDKMLEEAYGRQDAEALLKQLDGTIESEETSMIRFRDDLSYIPGK